jgi:hypothetical protein
VCWSDPEVPVVHGGGYVGSVDCVSGVFIVGLLATGSRAVQFDVCSETRRYQRERSQRVL